jgi:thiol-disulfide isomerase/thioredoxin
MYSPYLQLLLLSINPTHMFKTTFLTSLLLSLSVMALCQNEGRSVPDVTVKTMDNSSFQTGDISNDGNPIIINFWATWCSPCKRELNAIAEEFDEWVEETGVKLVAISIDDARNMHKVKPYVDGQSWDYDVYIDPNADFKRAMNVNNVPHTFLIDGNGHIVWQHNSYAPGDEDELYELVQKLANGETID